ncbi:MAG: HNH endonuclease [Chloroflexota bacterium]
MKTNRSSANGNGGSKWIRKDRRLAIYLRDRFTCQYCGRDLHGAAPADLTLDHLVPGHVAGNHHESNLVVACRRCNSQRQDRPWTDYATAGARDRIVEQTALDLAPYRRLAKSILEG